MTDDIPLATGTNPADMLSTQGIGLILFSTPDEWLSKIQELCDKVQELIGDGVDAVAHKIDTIGLGELIAIGVLTGPGLPLAIAGGKKLLHGKLDDWAQKAVNAFNLLVDGLQKLVDGLFGNPAKLIALGEGYLLAKTNLNMAVAGSNETLALVDDYWDGNAFDKYQDAVGFQTGAMAGIAGKLEAAANLMAEGANAIKQAWSDIVQCLIALASEIVQKLAEGADLGKLLLGEAGKPWELLASALEFVNGSTTAIRAMNSEADSAGKIKWATVNSGDPGFSSSNAWPLISGPDGRDIGEAGGWNDVA